MAFYNKIKWILGILMIFVLIIATNLIDRNNFVQVRDSVETIYEDRLVANDLIFEMLKSVHEKELAISISDTAYFKTKTLEVNKNLEFLVSNFEQTKLTSEEVTVFKDLKRNVEFLLSSESRLVNSKKSLQLLTYIQRLKTNLNDLAKIQLNEGNRQLSISKHALETVELFTQIEIFILVFLAILIQIIVMYKPK